MNRRTLFGGAAVAILTTGAVFADETSSSPETIRLWPHGASGLLNPDLSEIDLGKGDPEKTSLRGIRDPYMTVFRPARHNGAAMLIVPGGSYLRESFAWEGVKVARWLNTAGIAAFILTYRLPSEGWAQASDVPLIDAQRAMRLIRAKAVTYGLDPVRVGIIGFSAGGHLCASLATRYDASVYQAVDTADAQSARPLLAAPIYPVVTMKPDFAHMPSREALIGKAPSEAAVRLYSPEEQVTAETPPTFLVHGELDVKVPPENSINLRAALKRAGVKVELHLYPDASHGFSLADNVQQSQRLWPEAFLAFAQDRGLLTRQL